MTKTHKLTYEAQSALFPSANPNPGSAIVVSPQSALEWLQHFATTGRGADISIWASADQCSVRSKSDDYETGRMRKSIQTEVKVDLTEFQLYHVTHEVFLTFPLKEFRAAVLLAEALMLPIELHFSDSGEPLFLRIFGEAMNGEMVIATTEGKPPQASERSSTAAQLHQPHNSDPKAPAVRQTDRQREATPAYHVHEAGDAGRANGVREAAENRKQLLNARSAEVSRPEGTPRDPFQPLASVLEAVRSHPTPLQSTPLQQHDQGRPPFDQIERSPSPPSLPAEASPFPPDDSGLSQIEGSNGLFLGGHMSQSQNPSQPKQKTQSMPRSRTAVPTPPLRSSFGNFRQRQERSEPPRPQSISTSRASMRMPGSRRLDEQDESMEYSVPASLIADGVTGSRERIIKREYENEDETGEDSFDYSQAVEIIERGIDAGVIAVHGRSESIPADRPRGGPGGLESNQVKGIVQEKQQEEEMRRSGDESNADSHKVLVDEAEEEALPPTQPQQQQPTPQPTLLQEPKQGRATRGNPSPSPLVAASALSGRGTAQQTASTDVPQRKKFKPMF